MTKSLCVEKMGHVCGSRDALQVFQKEDGTYDGYCYACKTYVPNPYNDKPAGYKPVAIKRSARDVQKEMEEIAGCPTVALPHCGLSKEALEYFGVKVGLSEEDGVSPRMEFYPYHKDGEVVGYKVRLVETKRMWSTGDVGDVDLFGWDKAVQTGNKKIFITEGERDAIALFKIMKDHNKGGKWEDMNPAVVSIPHGAASAAKDISKHLKDIRRHFKEIVLVFDMDDAGKKAAEAVMLILPEAVVAALPAKDANACLLEGRAKACYNAVVFNAAKPKNSRIVNGRDLFEKGKEPPKWGLDYPWKQVTEATRGNRTGETVYFGAAPKMG